MSFSKGEYLAAAQSCVDSGEESVAVEYFIGTGLVELESLKFPHSGIRDYFYTALGRQLPRSEPALQRDAALPEGYRPIGVAYRRRFLGAAISSLAIGIGSGAYFGAEQVGATNQHVANRDHWTKVHTDEACFKIVNKFDRLVKFSGGWTVRLAALTDQQKQACGMFYDNYSRRWAGHMLDGQDPSKVLDQTVKLPSAAALQAEIQKETVKAKDYSMWEPIGSAFGFSIFGLIAAAGGFGFAVNKIENKRRRAAKAQTVTVPPPPEQLPESPQPKLIDMF